MYVGFCAVFVTVVSEANRALIYFAKESDFSKKRKKEKFILAVVTMWESPKPCGDTLL